MFDASSVFRVVVVMAMALAVGCCKHPTESPTTKHQLPVKDVYSSPDCQTNPNRTAEQWSGRVTDTATHLQKQKETLDSCQDWRGARTRAWPHWWEDTEPKDERWVRSSSFQLHCMSFASLCRLQEVEANVVGLCAIWAPDVTKDAGEDVSFSDTPAA